VGTLAASSMEVRSVPILKTTMKLAFDGLFLLILLAMVALRLPPFRRLRPRTARGTGQFGVGTGFLFLVLAVLLSRSDPVPAGMMAVAATVIYGVGVATLNRARREPPGSIDDLHRARKPRGRR
jgi:hypothetical protein